MPLDYQGAAQMVGLTDRRDLLLGLGAFAAAFGSQTRSGRAQTMKDSADLILQWENYHP
jgi:hypothetical protein